MFYHLENLMNFNAHELFIKRGEMYQWSYFMMGPNEAVLKYLSTQNRPYSANDIFLNLHKEFGKTAVQKSLDSLVGKGEIKEKIYGKQKVYAVQQQTTLSNDEMGKELGNLDAKINDISEKLSSVEQDLQKSEAQLRNMLSTPTTDNAKTEKQNLNTRVSKLREKLSLLSENSVLISEEDRVETKTKHEKFSKEWRKRKSTCMGIINTILDGYPKSKKALFEDIGIETDEDVGASLPGN